MKNVLFVHYGEDWIRGSEIVLLDMLTSSINLGRKPILWCNSKVLAQEATKIGAKVILDRFVNIGYWTLPRWDFFQYFKILLKTKKIIKAHDIDLVHCNNGAPCQWLSLVCKLMGVPLLLHLHARYQQRDRVILLFHFADRVIGVSKAVLTIFNDYEFEPKILSVVHNGISEKRVESKVLINIREMINAKEDDFVILYIGSLIKRKGIDTLIASLNRLGTMRSVKLAIFGSGEELSNLLQLIEQLKLGDVVSIFSEVSDVGSLYSSNADCFISVPLEEVFGLTLAEASLSGLPIISTTVPGVNEIYTHEQNALLVPAGNCDELAIAISRLIETPNFAKQLAISGKEHISNNYSLINQSAEVEQQYHMLFASRQKSFFSCFVATFFIFVKSCSEKLNNLLKRKVRYD